MAKSTHAQLQAQLAEREAALIERDARIAQLEAQVEAHQQAGKPTARQPLASVQALPHLQTEKPGARVLCPLNQEHGEVTPGVHGKCPQCFNYCVWANSEAGKRTLAQAHAPVAA
jgi:hypothetical protein